MANLPVVSLIVVVGLIIFLEAACASLAQRPTIIYILADDFGWANWELRNPDLITPNLLSLANEGILLQRHYVYKFCSPTRCSLLSGRLPLHVNQENSATEQPLAGIPRNMTTFPQKLKSLGYSTAQIGKWHAGQASHAVIPSGRGFDTSLGFFNFGCDHYSQIRGGQAVIATADNNDECSGVDLWHTNRPAYGYNGTYSGYTFGNEALRVVNDHHVAGGAPLFMFLAWQNIHPPLQVPDAYVEMQRAGHRTRANAMATFLDEAVGNLTNALKQKGMWENTLMVFSGDNGGYLRNGGDNTPLRGGKFSDWEGGVRVPSFVGGGWVPHELRGTKTDAIIHIADWAATFCELGGGDEEFCIDDPSAAAAGLPGIDSLSMANVLRGQNATSPRTEVALSVFTNAHARDPFPAAANFVASGGPRDLSYYVGGESLIVGDWKIIMGQQHDGPFSHDVNTACAALKPTGELCRCSTGKGADTVWPQVERWLINDVYTVCNNMCTYAGADGASWNTTQGPGVPCTCGPGGCLFNVGEDPNEVRDLSAERPDKLAELRERLEDLRGGVYAPDRGPIDERACAVIREEYGDFWGPWM